MEPSTTDSVCSTDQCDRAVLGYVPPRMNRKFLVESVMLLFALAATFPFMSWGSIAVLLVVGLTYLMGCRKTRLASVSIAPTMFLPFLATLGRMTQPWSSYEWHWFGMWFQLPGIIAEIPFHPLGNAAFQSVTATTTCGLFLLLVSVGRIHRHYRIASAIASLAISVPESALAYALYKG